MYKALYRKYRPTLFNDVVGQPGIVKTLQNAIKYNKIGHAYLFSGARGTGKTTIARLFAKAVNCLDKKENDACNKCKNCLDILNNITVDIIEIDGASNNGVDEIRELCNKIKFVPADLNFKVYIIDEVHMLSTGAFNALLKTLEEPPSHVIFILATTEAHKLPLTIISRCQNFYFNKITEKNIMLKLDEIIVKEKIKIDSQVINEIARLVNGGLRDAIGLLEQLTLLAEAEIKLEHLYLITASVSKIEIGEMMLQLGRGNVENLFSSVNKFYNEGKDFVRITEDAINFLKDYLLFAKNIKLEKVEQDIVKIYNELLNLKGIEETQKIIRDFNDELNNMKISNQPKLNFELLLLKNIKIEQKEDNKINKVRVVSPEKETQKQKKEVTKELVKNDLNEYKMAVLNNTLALAKRELLQEAVEKWDLLNTYLLNKDYKEIASILIDAKVVACSVDHMIVIYKYPSMVIKFDDNIKGVNALINKVMGRNYTIISLEEIKWYPVRKYYVDLKRQNTEIKLIPEEQFINNTEKLIKVVKSEHLQKAISIFGEDIIEVKG